MSVSRDKLKILLQDEIGQQWVSGDSYGWLLSKVAFLEERKNWMTDETVRLRQEVRILTKPKRARAILDLVEKQDVPRRSIFFSHRLTYDEFDWETWNELVESGAIQKVKCGKMTLYQKPKIKEEIEK